MNALVWLLSVCLFSAVLEMEPGACACCQTISSFNTTFCLLCGVSLRARVDVSGQLTGVLPPWIELTWLDGSGYYLLGRLPRAASNFAPQPSIQIKPFKKANSTVGRKSLK